MLLHLRSIGAAVLISLSGCQTLLDLERAHVDPALTTQPEVTEASEDEPTLSPPAAPSDAGGNSDQFSSAPAPQCEGFDNSRVKLIREDGQLPPLPDALPTPGN